MKTCSQGDSDRYMHKITINSAIVPCVLLAAVAGFGQTTTTTATLQDTNGVVWANATYNI
jgi:hypothetical protein